VHRGLTWTTDALYRESATEVQLYARHGILTADMEAAGLFAVGRHRHLPTGAAFAVADSLVNRIPRTDDPRTSHALDQLLQAALTALTAPALTARVRHGNGGRKEADRHGSCRS
jgi:uridine phosphorylase